MHWADGSVARARIQSYDSTFGVKKTDEITLHKAGVATKFKSQPGVHEFDDTKSWWTASDPGDPLGNYKAAWIERQRAEDGHEGAGQGRHQEGLLGRHRDHAAGAH